MRRLEFSPGLEDMEVKDITNGRFVFPPRPGKAVSLGELRKVIDKAGYEIEGTWIEATGALMADGRLRIPETGQVFRLEGEDRLRALREQAGGGLATAAGAWKVVDREEVILLEERRP